MRQSGEHGKVIRQIHGICLTRNVGLDLSMIHHSTTDHACNVFAYFRNFSYLVDFLCTFGGFVNSSMFAGYSRSLAPMARELDVQIRESHGHASPICHHTVESMTSLQSNVNPTVLESPVLQSASERISILYDMQLMDTATAERISNLNDAKLVKLVCSLADQWLGKNCWKICAHLYV